MKVWLHFGVLTDAGDGLPHPTINNHAVEWDMPSCEFDLRFFEGNLRDHLKIEDPLVHSVFVFDICAERPANGRVNAMLMPDTLLPYLVTNKGTV